jgi:hypothetical protein
MSMYIRGNPPRGCVSAALQCKLLQPVDYMLKCVAAALDRSVLRLPSLVARPFFGRFFECFDRFSLSEQKLRG